MTCCDHDRRRNAGTDGMEDGKEEVGMLSSETWFGMNVQGIISAQRAGVEHRRRIFGATPRDGCGGGRCVV